MLLGQLYYFEKKIELIAPLIQAGNIAQIELAGLEYEDIKPLETFDTQEASTKLLAIFTQKYTQLLSDNKLIKALETWKLITNPFKQSGDTVIKFPLFHKVNNWLDGTEDYSILELIDEIGIVGDEDRYAVLYGLQVLSTLTNTQKNISKKTRYQSELQKHIVPNSEPCILVVCSTVLSPLFTNLNCVFVNAALNNPEIIQSIIEQVLQKSNLSLILIDTKQFEDIQKSLLKKLPIHILVAPFDLDIAQSDGYFDHLVKKTLGVRLV